MAPKIFNDFFVANKKNEKKFGIKVTLKGGAASNIEIKEWSKLGTLKKKLKKYFRLYYSGR